MKPDVDRLLRRWPAKDAGGRVVPAEDDSSIPEAEAGHWDRRADAILSAAKASSKDTKVVASLLEAPLPAEAGEGSMLGSSSSSGGEKSMSKDDSKSSPPENTPVPSSRTARPSLKELAQRASQRPPEMGRPKLDTPVPPAASTPIPGASRASSPSQPVVRSKEASDEDSGVVNLNALNESATPEQKKAAETAKPAEASLFDDDAKKKSEKAAVAKSAPANDAKPAVAARANEDITKTSSGRGVIIGLTIAAVGVAAALAIFQRGKQQQQTDASLHVNVPTQIQAAPTTVAQAPSPKTTAQPSATPTNEVNPDALPDDSKQPKVAMNAPSNGGPSSASEHAKEAPTGAPVVATPLPPSNGAKPGDLTSEMQKAVGDNGASKSDDAKPEQAAGSRGNQNIPEQPSQGAVQGAIGSVMGAAKACVSGADDVTRANVTFSSAGNVTSVSVNGWAAANGQSGCVKAALQGAKVGPFSKPSYVATVTIRP